MGEFCVVQYSGKKKWINPQAVPRGLLRLYVLSMLAKGSETGYSVMRAIEEKTEGAWRPGPGTVYPLLRSLVKEGLIERVESSEDGGIVRYSATKKGREDFDQMRRTLASAGRRERIMIRLFADLLPAEAWAAAFVNRQREIFDVFQEKVSQIPKQQREATLKEAKAMLEANVSWLDSQLRARRSE